MALARGGATETVDDGVTGRLVADLTGEAFGAALASIDTLPSTRAERRARALRFSPDAFAAGFTALVDTALESRAARGAAAAC